jgi:hypothetical protein
MILNNSFNSECKGIIFFNTKACLKHIFYVMKKVIQNKNNLCTFAIMINGETNACILHQKNAEQERYIHCYAHTHNNCRGIVFIPVDAKNIFFPHTQINSISLPINTSNK